MRERGSLRGMPVLGVAAAGMVLGHWIGYLLAIPDRTLRARVLAASGHAYWLSAVQTAVAMAAIGLAVLAVRRLRSRREPSPDAVSRLALPMRLAIFQVSMFVMVEVTERLIVGEPIGQMFGHHVFFLGVLVQLLVAAAGARFLLWFHRTIECIAEWIRRPQVRPERRAPRRPAVLIIRPVLVLQGAAGLRSPPSR